LTCGSPGWGGAVKQTLHAAEPSRPDVVAQRKPWPQRLAGVREAIEGVGARLEYLPPYSADVEQGQTDAQKPRTPE
jgi:hypothetical protein